MAIKSWQRIARRLARMNRVEMRDRFRQEFAKRQDAALAAIGFDFTRGARARIGGRTGNFFFRDQAVDSILALLRQRLPGEAERIVLRADRICEHKFDLLGYRGLEYPSPINWHVDAVHGKQAAKKSFYKVRYLDYGEVGDSKVTWELNRHQHLVILSKAFRLTGNRQYSDEALSQWRDWQRQNPYPIGINWASSLEVAFRSLSWLWMYHLLRGVPGIEDFRDELLRGLALHGRHVERYLSTYFSPNTHLLGEGVALFFIGTLFPEIAAADRWQSLGWKIVLKEAEHQVLPDGFHFEQSTYYHVYALDFFLHAAILASVNDVEIPAVFEKTIEKMLTALSLLGRGGAPPRFGDDDGGRLFDPQRNRDEHLLDPLAAGAILFQRGDFKKTAGGLREETLWLLGEEGVRQWDSLEEAALPTESVHLSDAGFCLLPAGKATQLVFDAGPLGRESGGHGHADALSVCLQSNGDSLLIDPGTFEYVGPGNERNTFRGTAMHNTVRIDGADQAEPTGPFSWKQLTRSKVERWISGETFDYVVASHDGYEHSAATHRRSILSLKNGVYLIRDVAAGSGRHRVELAWHLPQDLQLVKEGLFRVREASHGLALLPVHGHGWAEEVRRESWSPVYGQKAPMTVLIFSTDRALPADFATLLLTLEEANTSPARLIRIPDGASAVVQYDYASAGWEYSFFFGKHGEPWKKGLLSSDAELVCWQRSLAEGEQRLILCGGSFAQAGGEMELRCARVVEWAELIVKNGTSNVFGSDPSALPNLTLETSPPEAPSELR